MIKRDAEKLIRSYSKQFRALAIVGPRQSGKTTLVKSVFSQKEYVSLENPDERMLAETDPKAFLARFPKGAILDEAQRVPLLFSYLQQILDETQKEGLFILTGSNNFLLQQSVSQTLAGRIGYIDLLPLSFAEIQEFGGRHKTTNELILQGCYPELFDKKRTPGIWYPSYIRTYVERDVKLLRNIENSVLFNRFLQLCAGRTGQQLNVAALSNECGIDVKTVNAWLGILQSSYIIYLLPPFFTSYNKRIVKTPKLYFTDTGLACSLLGIRSQQELSVSHFRGSLFENYVIIDMLKKKYNQGSGAQLYYWRDNKGVEVDLLLNSGNKLLQVEIKSAQTFQEDQLNSMNQWNRFSGNKGGLLLYDGEQQFRKTNGIRVQNWRTIHDLRL
jgi:predicted AAA+ superfamily ATPase